MDALTQSTFLPAALLLYPTLGALYIWRRWGGSWTSETFDRRALAAVLGAAAIAATLAIVIPSPPCEPSIYNAYGVSCEIAPRGT